MAGGPFGGERGGVHDLGACELRCVERGVDVPCQDVDGGGRSSEAIRRGGYCGVRPVDDERLRVSLTAPSCSRGRPSGDAHKRRRREGGGELRFEAAVLARVDAGSRDERLTVDDGSVGELGR